MSPAHDPNFATLMPNFGFTCPKCKRGILIYTELPILPPDAAETAFDLRCKHPQCGWEGTLNGRDAYPV